MSSEQLEAQFNYLCGAVLGACEKLYSCGPEAKHIASHLQSALMSVTTSRYPQEVLEMSVALSKKENIKAEDIQELIKTWQDSKQVREGGGEVVGQEIGSFAAFMESLDTGSGGTGSSATSGSEAQEGTSGLSVCSGGEALQPSEQQADHEVVEGPMHQGQQEREAVQDTMSEGEERTSDHIHQHEHASGDLEEQS